MNKSICVIVLILFTMLAISNESYAQDKPETDELSESIAL